MMKRYGIVLSLGHSTWDPVSCATINELLRNKSFAHNRLPPYATHRLAPCRHLYINLYSFIVVLLTITLDSKMTSNRPQLSVIWHQTHIYVSIVFESMQWYTTR